MTFTDLPTFGALLAAVLFVLALGAHVREVIVRKPMTAQKIAAGLTALVGAGAMLGVTMGVGVAHLAASGAAAAGVALVAAGIVPAKYRGQRALYFSSATTLSLASTFLSSAAVLSGAGLSKLAIGAWVVGGWLILEGVFALATSRMGDPAPAEKA